jgi:flagellar motor protein MotB
LTLSQARALSVQRYLQAKAELSAFTFATHGYGEGRPVASNAAAEGRARNRRVDVVLQPGAAN